MTQGKTLVVRMDKSPARQRRADRYDVSFESTSHWIKSLCCASGCEAALHYKSSNQPGRINGKALNPIEAYHSPRQSRIGIEPSSIIAGGHASLNDHRHDRIAP